MDLELAQPATAVPVAPIAAAVAAALIPAIGQPWPGCAGVYAGVSRGEDGAPDAHLVLLDVLPGASLDWSAAMAWSEGLGDGARLPTRFEAALLYAHLRDEFRKDDWYWTSTQYSESGAWYQDLYYGYQYYDVKKYEAHARAVRRFPA
jgi:hypothetical protein